MSHAKKPTKIETLLRNSDKSLPLLDVQDLTVEFATRRGIVRAVEHVNVSVAKGETLAIVGESGSGKSVTSYAVMRILDRAGRIAEGTVMFSGVDLRATPENEMRDLRGREMSMIFQSPRRRSTRSARSAARSRTCCCSMHRWTARWQAKGDRNTRACAYREAPRTLPCLSFRALWRHVPAGRHRAGARLQTATSHRR